MLKRTHSLPAKVMIVNTSGKKEDILCINKLVLSQPVSAAKMKLSNAGVLTICATRSD